MCKEIFQKIAKARMRWWIIAGALLGFAIGTPTIVPYVTSGLPDHPYAEWTDSRLPFKDCPQDYLWFNGYSEGCVPQHLVGKTSSSEKYVEQNPSFFNDEGKNILNVKDAIETQEEFQGAQRVLWCSYNYNKIKNQLIDEDELINYFKICKGLIDLNELPIKIEP